MSKYRVYIDEVGNSDLRSAENPNHRFLSLTGVITTLDHIREIIHPEMEDFKARFFSSHPDEPVILHRKELVNARFPFHSLRNLEIRQNFDRELLRHLSRWTYTVVTVVIDKLEHLTQYKVWRYDPYHYCLAVLLERFLFFLEQADSRGDALAESRGGKEDRRLKESFNRLWEEGTQFVKAERFQNALTSRKLKVKPKQNNIAGLQLADLLAHPSRREVLLENKKIANVKETPFGDQIIKILATKYYHRGTRARGYGKKLLP